MTKQTYQEKSTFPHSCHKKTRCQWLHTCHKKTLSLTHKYKYTHAHACLILSRMHACPCVYLFNARFVWVEQWSGLHVFRDEFAAHFGHLLPLLQHRQSQVLLRLFLQACRTAGTTQEPRRNHTGTTYQAYIHNRSSAKMFMHIHIYISTWMYIDLYIHTHTHTDAINTHTNRQVHICFFLLI